MPNIDLRDLSSTIIPRSDQLNSEQLLSGSMIITVTEVRVGSGEDQPVSVHYTNDAGRPFKPCKTMRKVLIHAWGKDATKWAGKSMELFNEPSIKFGGEIVGGIRIARLSDIAKGIEVSLTATKGKKTLHKIGLLRIAEMEHVDHHSEMNTAASIDELKAAFAASYKSTKDAAARAAFKATYDARTAALTPSASLLPDYLTQVDNATSAETATLALDEARDVLTPDEHEKLTVAWRAKWGNA